MQPTTWNDERITAYVLGELLAGESARLEAEMQSNAEIANAVAEARSITNQLSMMFAAEPPMALDAVKRSQLLETPDQPMKVEPEALADHESNTANPNTAVSAGVSGSNPNRSTLRYLALAATLLLVGTLGTLAYQSRLVRPASTELALGEAVMSPASQSDIAPLGSMSAVNEVDDLARAESMPERELERSKVLSEFAGEKDSRPLSEATGRLADLTRDSMPAEPAAATKWLEESPAKPDSAKKESYAFGMDASAPAAPTPSSGPQGVNAPGPFSASPETMGDFFGGSGTVVEGFSNDSGVLQPTMEVGKWVEGQSLVENVERLDNLSTIDLRTKLQVESKAKDSRQHEAPSSLDGEGRGPGLSGDRFEPIQENDFRRVNEEPLSTFSIDVDTASYSKVRQFILQAGGLPPAGAVRIEELVNYFDYDYEPPGADSEHPLAARVEIAACPWKPEHRLARIAIKGKVMANESRPASNLVFLVDTSGSMNEPNKLPLVKQGLEKLVGQLGQRDRVAIVVYAGSAGLVLDSTSASDRSTILRKINQMQSGGSTNGGEGIRLAYQVARDHFIKDGVNRVILCSDGDFNVGTTSNDELVRLVETESKGGIDITVLGFGMGNHNDSMMEQVSGRGNGNYAFIDTAAEAQRVLVAQTSSTLVTIARDVKIQVEFNPLQVAAYRLIGYENRKLANEDFKDDTKDAGEIGAGHNVTALYELIPVNGDVAALAPPVDELRYQKVVKPTEAGLNGEWMTVGLRYKKPDSDTSIPVSFPVTDSKHDFATASSDFKFATAVAGFGMLLRSSQYAGNWTLSDVVKVAESSKGNDQNGLRSEFVEIVRRAGQLRGSEQ